MSLDLGILAVLALFAWNGSMAGLIEQATHWSALAFGYFAAWPAATRLAPSVAPKLRVSPFGVEVSMAAVFYLAFYAVGALVLQRILRMLVGQAEGKAWNRWGGALLGLGKGAVVVYAALSLVLFFEAPLTKALGPLPARASKAVALARAHNLFSLGSSTAETVLRARRRLD